MDERSQSKGWTLRGMEPKVEPLDFLLETRNPTLLLVDERHEVASGQALKICDEGQRSSLSPGLSDTL